jgi:hypothetical protein
MPLRTGVGPLPLFPETGRESEGSDSDALCHNQTRAMQQKHRRAEDNADQNGASAEQSLICIRVIPSYCLLQSIIPPKDFVSDGESRRAEDAQSSSSVCFRRACLCCLPKRRVR